MSAKEYAIKDMVSMGVLISYLKNSKAIIEFTKEEDK